MDGEEVISEFGGGRDVVKALISEVVVGRFGGSRC
jgi:hypothetical protein